MEENNISKVIRPALKKKSKAKLWLWIFGVMLVLAVGYIGYTKYGDWRYDQDEQIYQEGAYLGYNQAILQVVENVNTCQQVPITYLDNTGENRTIKIFKVECLQQLQQ